VHPGANVRDPYAQVRVRLKQQRMAHLLQRPCGEVEIPREPTNSSDTDDRVERYGNAIGSSFRCLVGVTYAEPRIRSG
jgi:hypothetical protein